MAIGQSSLIFTRVETIPRDPCITSRSRSRRNTNTEQIADSQAEKEDTDDCSTEGKDFTRYPALMLCGCSLRFEGVLSFQEGAPALYGHIRAKWAALRNPRARGQRVVRYFSAYGGAHVYINPRCSCSRRMEVAAFKCVLIFIVCDQRD